MKLHEYQAKELLAKYGVPVNEGEVARGSEAVVVVGSAEGGVEIEQVAKEKAGAIIKVFVDPRMGLLDYQARQLAFGMELGEHAREFTRIAKGLAQTLIDHDASLVEITPLALEEPKVKGQKPKAEGRGRWALGLSTLTSRLWGSGERWCRERWTY